MALLPAFHDLRVWTLLLKSVASSTKSLKYINVVFALLLASRTMRGSTAKVLGGKMLRIFSLLLHNECPDFWTIHLLQLVICITKAWNVIFMGGSLNIQVSTVRQHFPYFWTINLIIFYFWNLEGDSFEIGVLTLFLSLWFVLFL